MSLYCGNVGAANPVTLPTGVTPLDNLQAFTVVQLVRMSQNFGTYLFYKGDNAQKTVQWTGGPMNGTVKTSGTFHSFSSSGNVFTAGSQTWRWVYMTFSNADGMRCYTGLRVAGLSPVSEISYTTRVVGTGTPTTDPGAGWMFGNRGVAPNISNILTGDLEVVGVVGRVLALSEMEKCRLLKMPPDMLWYRFDGASRYGAARPRSRYLAHVPATIHSLCTTGFTPFLFPRPHALRLADLAAYQRERPQQADRALMGAVQITGVGVVQLPALAVQALGAVAIAGTGALTIPRVTVAATDAVLSTLYGRVTGRLILRNAIAGALAVDPALAGALAARPAVAGALTLEPTP